MGGEAGHAAAAAASCRVYRGERGLSGVPSAESIAVAIADIKVASLWRARVGRNGGNRTTGNRLVPFCKQRRLNHSKQLYMIGTDSSNSLALPTSRAVAASSRAVCEMPAATSTVQRAGKSCCCPEGSRNYGVEGAAGTGAASPSGPPGAGASLGAAAAFRRCTARRRCAILRCGTSVLAATLFGAVSGGLRAGCGLLSTGRSGLGCGGSLHWAELAVASQNLVHATGDARSGLAIAGRHLRAMGKANPARS